MRIPAQPRGLPGVCPDWFPTFHTGHVGHWRSEPKRWPRASAVPPLTLSGSSVASPVRALVRPTSRLCLKAVTRFRGEIPGLKRWPWWYLFDCMLHQTCRTCCRDPGPDRSLSMGWGVGAVRCFVTFVDDPCKWLHSGLKSTAAPRRHRSTPVRIASLPFRFPACRDPADGWFQPCWGPRALSLARLLRTARAVRILVYPSGCPV